MRPKGQIHFVFIIKATTEKSMTSQRQFLLILPVIALVIVFAGCHNNAPASLNLDQTPDSIELFAPGIVSTDLAERDVAISPDGNEIIYTLGTYNQKRRCLVSIRKTESGWGEKQVVSFSGVYQDIEPFFTADGNTLYFASTRPMPDDSTREDYNIWKSRRVEGGWGDPEPLSELINTKEGEYYPSVSRNGNLYFTATREGGFGIEDIWMSRLVDGIYQQPEVLDSNINSSTYEFNAFINPDEDLLIFGSWGREDDLGGGDLYFSRRSADGNWSKATHMGPPVNSSKLDYCPFVDYPRGNFYFTSERIPDEVIRITSPEEITDLARSPLNGLGNVYRIAINKLDLK